MKKHHIFLVVFGLLSLFWTRSMAQTDMIVSFNDGTNPATYSITEAGKVYFGESDLFVDKDGSGNPVNIPIASIQKVHFDTKTDDNGNEVSIIEPEKKENAILYPNPATDYVRIANLAPEKVQMSIYSISGQLMLRRSYISNEQVDISTFPKGYYVVVIDGRIFKFCKL